jgi:hypothetical protein
VGLPKSDHVKPLRESHNSLGGFASVSVVKIRPLKIDNNLRKEDVK